VKTKRGGRIVVQQKEMKVFLKLEEIVGIYQLKKIIIILEWLGETNVNESRAGMIMIERIVELKEILDNLKLKKLLSPWLGWAELSDNEVRGKGDNENKSIIVLSSTEKERETFLEKNSIHKGGRDGAKRNGMVGAAFEKKRDISLVQVDSHFVRST